VGKDLTSLMSADDIEKASSCAPFAGSHVSSGLFRALSVDHDENGVRTPESSRVGCVLFGLAVLEGHFDILCIGCSCV